MGERKGAADAKLVRSYLSVHLEVDVRVLIRPTLARLVMKSETQ